MTLSVVALVLIVIAALVVGAMLGALTIAICVTAGRADERMHRK